MKVYTRIIDWITSIPVGLIFILAASGKFSFESNMYENFLNWGYSGFLLITVGLFEAIGGLLLFFPSKRRYGCVLLSIVMTGATITHFRNPEMGQPYFPLGLLILLGVVLYLNRKEYTGYSVEMKTSKIKKTWQKPLR